MDRGLLTLVAGVLRKDDFSIHCQVSLCNATMHSVLVVRRSFVVIPSTTRS